MPENVPMRERIRRQVTVAAWVYSNRRRKELGVRAKPSRHHLEPDSSELVGRSRAQGQRRLLGDGTRTGSSQPVPAHWKEKCPSH